MFRPKAEIDLPAILGAVCAMHDAVVLANWINILTQDSTKEEMEKVFQEYKDERMPHVMQAYEHSQSNGHLIGSVRNSLCQKLETKKKKIAMPKSSTDPTFVYLTFPHKLYIQTFRGKLTRWIVNLLPKSVLAKSAIKNVGNRPHAAFLPPPPVRGSVKPDPQPSLTKTREIMAKQGQQVVSV